MTSRKRKRRTFFLCLRFRLVTQKARLIFRSFATQEEQHADQHDQNKGHDAHESPALQKVHDVHDTCLSQELGEKGSKETRRYHSPSELVLLRDAPLHPNGLPGRRPCRIHSLMSSAPPRREICQVFYSLPGHIASVWRGKNKIFRCTTVPTLTHPAGSVSLITIVFVFPSPSFYPPDGHE